MRSKGANPLEGVVITVDFDGTIVEHKYPNIGEPKPYAFEVLKQLQEAGAKLILWTCREDMRKRKYLTEAVKFCKDNGIEFDAVNEALQSHDWRDPDECKLRKPHGHYFIDDLNVGGFLGWDIIRKIIFFGQTITWTAAAEDTHFHIKKQFNDSLGETQKSHTRRVNEGWFEKYAPSDKPGIDIGCQYDPLNQTFRRWDIIFGDEDATFMKGVEDASFFTVYASHILEHLHNPVAAIQNWFRILKPGGHLIINVPHRDLYEKKTELPSKWNPAHKFFYLPDKSEAPNTISLKDLVARAIPEGEIVELRTLDEGYNPGATEDEHPGGEFSIELIVRKN